MRPLLHSFAIAGVSGSKTTKPVAIKDVLIGEVWLASGQSNMATGAGPDGAKADTPLVIFDHVAGGLISKTGPTLKGFVLAGADKRFVTTDARIDGDSVVVSTTEIDKPLAVRYAWTKAPSVSLFNAAGLPALPFRSDDW